MVNPSCISKISIQVASFSFGITTNDFGRFLFFPFLLGIFKGQTGFPQTFLYKKPIQTGVQTEQRTGCYMWESVSFCLDIPFQNKSLGRYESQKRQFFSDGNTKTPPKKTMKIYIRCGPPVTVANKDLFRDSLPKCNTPGGHDCILMYT